MWLYDGNRIYVQKITKGASQIAPRLQPLSGGSIIQSFGYDSTIRNVSALVVGDTVEQALEALSKDGMLPHTLVTPEATYSGWALKSYNSDRTESTCQTIDITQDSEAPVYNVELELWRQD